MNDLTRLAAIVLSLPILSFTGRALAETGTWLGQNNHDYVSLARVPGPSGIQDIEVRIDGLPAGRTITHALCYPYGSGIYEYNGTTDAAMVLQRAPGATSGVFFLEPYQVETGRAYDFQLTYDDGSTADVWVQGGAVDPNLRASSDAAQVTWLGQNGNDRAGRDSGVGPNGTQDVVLTIARLNPRVAIKGVTVGLADGSGRWTYGPNPRNDVNAEFQLSATDATTGTFWFDPPANEQGKPFFIDILYADNTSDHETFTGGASNPALSTPVRPPE